MSSLNKKVTGSVMVEYAIVTILLMIMLWYALMGGSGSWINADRTPNHGNLTSPKPSPDTQAPPGLFQALDDRQHTFTRSLSQP